jgi:uncharacterized protein
MAFLTARWRYLVMLNYEVSPDTLAQLVPAGTTLDAWQGRALVSLVGFRFLDTRLAGVPVPFHRDFDEVNLRFYVRRGDRRGVTFVRELVPRRAIAWLARLAYNEPYVVASMTSRTPDDATDSPGRLEYRWSFEGRGGQLAATAVGAPVSPAPDSEATFITEHYWGYTRQRDGGTVEYRVRHPPWRVWQATDPMFDADVAGLYGPRFARLGRTPPVSAFIAEGSGVDVSWPRRVST